MTEYVDAEKLIMQLKNLSDIHDDPYKVSQAAIRAILNLAVQIVNENTITFDADGWCWDLSKAPVGEYLDFIILDSKYMREANCKIGDSCSPYNRYRDADGMLINPDVIVAWRISPAIPKFPEVKP